MFCKVARSIVNDVKICLCVFIRCIKCENLVIILYSTPKELTSFYKNCNDCNEYLFDAQIRFSMYCAVNDYAVLKRVERAEVRHI